MGPEMEYYEQTIMWGYNIMDVYPWLQSYLGAYMLGGAGSFQMRVVRG